jgi:L-serine deaminase
MIGAVGTLLGEHKINIRIMKVSPEVQGNAMMVLGLDEEISPELLRNLESIPDLHSARLAKI